MAKQKKAPARKAARPSRKTVKTSQARRTTKPSRAGGSTARPSKAAVKRPVATKPVKAVAPRRAAPPRTVEPAAPHSPPTPQAAPRKPGFYEAVAIYERGVQGLQRHDFAGAAELFRTVIERYPEERELLERARLYLRVCERETARNSPPPETPAEQVYAATVSLNAGDHVTALHHLQRAVTADPDNDHAHYIMASALSMRGRLDEALEHLHRAVELNPDNRSQARQDPDLESLRHLDSFRAILDAPVGPRRRPRRR
ncbi:MAG: tetratricopeptide repeat protein [Vicinamibacterales bacterium]